MKTLYVFVEIAIDTPHLCLSVRRNFPSSRKAFKTAILEAPSTAPGAKVSIVLDASDEVLKSESGPASSSGLDEKDVIKDEDTPTKLALVSTIQFVAAVQALKEDLEKALPPLADGGVEVGMGSEGMLARMKQNEIGVWRGKYDIVVPQARPLSPGEVLGCTAPKLTDVDALMYVPLFLSPHLPPQ